MSLGPVLTQEEATMEWCAERAGRNARRRAPVDRIGAAPNATVADRYRVRSLLGRGGMGAVWLADDLVLRRPVAMKWVAEEERGDASGALREARAAGRVAHPGVIRVHDVIVVEHGGWIVMEALRAELLSAVLRDRGRLPVDRVAQIGAQLLSALGAIHDAGLVHRDVKPGNVHLLDGGRVVLTDFGLSTPRGKWGGLRAGNVAGSLPYLAPESIIDGEFGPSSDLYALGVTLFRAVEGRPPFDTSSPLASLESALSAQPEPFRYAGPLAELLGGLLEKEPTRRMSAQQAGRCLHEIPPAVEGATFHPGVHGWVA
jgi:serine/threonine protein kinase